MTTHDPRTRHARRVEQDLADPAYRDEYERTTREIELTRLLLKLLDDVRERRGTTKQSVAHGIGRPAASIRRMWSRGQRSNPELRTVMAILDELDAKLVIEVPTRVTIGRPIDQRIVINYEPDSPGDPAPVP